MSEKTFLDVVGEIAKAISEAGSIVDGNGKDKIRKTILAKVGDLCRTAKTIPDNEILIVSTFSRLASLNESGPTSQEMNKAVQRLLISVAKSEETKEFVSKNMD